MLTCLKISNVVSLLGFVVVCAMGVSSAAQQPSNSPRHAQTSNPIYQLKQLGQRVQQRYRRIPTQDPQSQARQRSDDNLKRAGHPANFRNHYSQASRIQSSDQRSRNVRATFLQEPERHDPNGWEKDSYWPDDSDISNEAPPNPIRNQPTEIYIPPQRVAQGSGSRDQGYHQNSHGSQQGYQQPMYPQDNYQRAGIENLRAENGYGDPGILGANVGTGEPRFRRFSSRIPASERVIKLEDELHRINEDLKAREFDNKFLKGKLDENERLLTEIQTAIDDAINQLTDAANVNQQLRNRITQLENENLRQKLESEQVLEGVRAQLRDLLAAELSGGN